MPRLERRWFCRNVEDAIGNTPLLDLTGQLSIRNGSRLFAKLEFLNPGGSVKDRPALYILRDALRSGLLGPGKTVLDASSGNMALSMAMISTSLGYRVKLVLPRNVSSEKLGLLRLLGAELVLTDPAEGIDGAIRVARSIVEADPKSYFYANQYDNPSNLRAHYETTGPEIISQTEGRVTHLVAGVGTSGTLMGAGRRLREYNPSVKLFEVQPDSPLHGIEGLKYMSSSIRPQIYDPGFADHLIEVPTEEAIRHSRLLASRCGVLSGISGGANVAAALRVAEENPGSVVVTVIPDGSARYLDILTR